MLPFNLNIFPKLKDVYIVGGSIRDLLLGLKPTDYDLAVIGDPEKFANAFASRISGHCIKLGKHDQIIMRVIAKDNHFDINFTRPFTRFSSGLQHAGSRQLALPYRGFKQPLGRRDRGSGGLCCDGSVSLAKGGFGYALDY